MNIMILNKKNNKIMSGPWYESVLFGIEIKEIMFIYY